MGTVEAALEVAVEYAKERFTFGRAIGSYQAIKHGLVEILRRVENAKSLLIYAGFAFSDHPAEVAYAASCARSVAGGALDFAARQLIATHGGIGATWEHDAPLTFRRAQLARRLVGGTADATDRVAEELLAGRRVAACAATAAPSGTAHLLGDQLARRLRRGRARRWGWCEPDEEVHRFVNEQRAADRNATSTGAACTRSCPFGRRSTSDAAQQDFIRDFASSWRDADKVVYSRTLAVVPTPRTRLEREFDPEAVRRMKQSAPHDLASAARISRRRH